MIIFNIPGVIIAGSSVAIAYVFTGWAIGEWHGSTALSYFICGTLAFAMDVAYRQKQSEDPSGWRFFRPTTGGHVVFIPVWVLGGLWFTMGCLDVAGGKGHARAKHDAFMEETIALLEETTTLLKSAAGAEERVRVEESVQRSVRRIQELADLNEGLDRSERKRLDRKYGDRVSSLIEQIQLRSTR